MFAIDIITYALCRRFVKKSLAGLGALKGSPCKVKEIVPIYSDLDPTKILYNEIHLLWDSNEDRDPTLPPMWTEERVTVLDNGRGIYNIEFDPEHSTAEYSRFIVTFYDNTTDTFDLPSGTMALKKKVVDELPQPPASADKNCIYLVPIEGKPGVYEQWIAVEDDATHAWTYLSLGSTEIDVSTLQKKIDPLINRNYINYDPATKAEKPSVPNVVGALNEHQDVLGTYYDYANDKIDGLNTYHNKTVKDALNDMGNLEDLEDWDPDLETPATLVDAINLANKEYSLDADATVDRSKYMDILRLHKDPKDGSPIVQKGDTDYIYRVDMKEQAIPSDGDYRTYNLKVGDSLFDAKDVDEVPFGSVHIPTVKIVKEIPPTNRKTEHFDVTALDWQVITAGQDYKVEVEMASAYSAYQSEPVVLTMSPPIPNGVLSCTPEIGDKTMIFHLSAEAGKTVVPDSTRLAITYDAEDDTLQTQYYLDIAGLGYDPIRCGVKIDMMKDAILDGAGVEECVEKGVPLPQLDIGDKYLWLAFLLADGTRKYAYIAVKDFMQIYVGEKAIHVVFDDVEKKEIIKLFIYDPDANEALVQTDDGLRIMNATEDQYGVVEFATEPEVLAADAVTQKVVKPYDIYNFAVNSESVDGDLQGLYIDPATGEKVNKTIINAINELATQEIVELPTPDEEDIATYRMVSHPEASVTDLLGVKIHDVKTVLYVDSLDGVAEPKDYIIYYLTTPEGDRDTGLYMYILPDGWIRVGGNDAIINVDALPTEFIKDNSFYELNNYDTVNGRFDLTSLAKEQGYYADEDGIHYRGEVSQDWTWAAILIDWANWYGDEIEDDVEGPIFSVTHRDGTTELIFDYKPVSNSLFYHYEDTWIEVSPVFRDKYMDAEENHITNIFTKELKPQTFEEDGKTFDVNAAGEWELGYPAQYLEVDTFEDVVGDEHCMYYLTKTCEVGDKTYAQGLYGYHKDEDEFFPMQERKNAYERIQKIEDYFYAVDYDKLDYDYAEEWFEKNDPPIAEGGYSIVEPGGLLGNSHTHVYNEACSFVVNTSDVPGVKKSLTMVSELDELTEKFVAAEEYSELYRILPFMATDGMNEDGLQMSVTTVPFEDTATPTTGTTPAEGFEKTISTTMLVRFVLDHFGEVDDAVDYLKNYCSIYVPESNRMLGYEVHFLLSKNEHSVILEFHDNELVVLNADAHSRSDIVDPIDTIPVIAGFNLKDVIFNPIGEWNIVWVPGYLYTHSPVEDNNIQLHGFGLERYCYLASYNEYPTYRWDISSLMSHLNSYGRYTSAYTAGGEFASEFCGIDGYNLTISEHDLETGGYESYPMVGELRKIKYPNRSRDKESPYYGTKHSIYKVVYDSASMTARVVVQDGSSNYDFKLQSNMYPIDNQTIIYNSDNRLRAKAALNLTDRSDTNYDDIMYVQLLPENPPHESYDIVIADGVTDWEITEDGVHYIPDDKYYGWDYLGAEGEVFEETGYASTHVDRGDYPCMHVEDISDEHGVVIKRYAWGPRYDYTTGNARIIMEHEGQDVTIKSGDHNTAVFDMYNDKQIIGDTKGRLLNVQNDSDDITEFGKGVWYHSTNGDKIRLDASGGLVLVSELPELEDAEEGIVYYLTEMHPGYDVASYGLKINADLTREWVIVGMERENAYTSINRVYDYCWNVEYDSVDYLYASKYAEMVNLGSCTSITKGKFLARNLDWFYDNTAEFIVQTKAVCGRHATLGMTAAFSAMTKEVVEKGGYNPLWKVVPGTIVDGMNDAGLGISVNVCPLEDGMTPTTGTHPEITDPMYSMPTTMIPRIVLDNFDSIAQAYTALSNSFNLYTPKHIREQGFEPHYILRKGDEHDYWYFEDNQLKHTDIFFDDCGAQVMTNFRLHDVDFLPYDPAHPELTVYTPVYQPGHYATELGITPHGSGLERFNWMLYRLRISPTSQDTQLMTIMKDFWYTRTYRSNPKGLPYGGEWYTEMVGGDVTIDTPLSTFVTVCEPAADELYKARTRDDPQTWQTTHTAIYNLETGTLMFSLQEMEMYGQVSLKMSSEIQHIDISRDGYYTAKSRGTLIPNAVYFVYD